MMLNCRVVGQECIRDEVCECVGGKSGECGE